MSPSFSPVNARAAGAETPFTMAFAESETVSKSMIPLLSPVSANAAAAAEPFTLAIKDSGTLGNSMIPLPSPVSANAAAAAETLAITDSETSGNAMVRSVTPAVAFAAEQLCNLIPEFVTSGRERNFSPSTAKDQSMRAVPAFMSRFSIRVPTPGPEREEPETTVDACGRSRLLKLLKDAAALKEKGCSKEKSFFKNFPFPSFFFFVTNTHPESEELPLRWQKYRVPFISLCFFLQTKNSKGSFLFIFCLLSPSCKHSLEAHRLLHGD